MTKQNVPGYPAQITIEPGRLKLLSKAIGTRDWQQLPLTLPFCLMSDEDRFADFLVKAMQDWGIDAARTMHAKQSFTYHEPMRPGDTVTVTLSLGDRYTKKGGKLAFTELEGEVLNSAGELLAEQKVTLVTIARDNSAGDPQ